MSEASIISEAPSQIPEVMVKYEGLTPKESLFKVDGKKLGGLLFSAGIPQKNLLSLVITADEGKGYAVGNNDPHFKQVTLYQPVLADGVRNVYRTCLEQIGITPNKEVAKQSLILNLLRNDSFRYFFPPYWPYLLQ